MPLCFPTEVAAVRKSHTKIYAARSANECKSMSFIWCLLLLPRLWWCSRIFVFGCDPHEFNTKSLSKAWRVIATVDANATLYGTCFIININFWRCFQQQRQRHVLKRHIIVIECGFLFLKVECLKGRRASESFIITYAWCISALTINMTTRLTFINWLSAAPRVLYGMNLGHARWAVIWIHNYNWIALLIAAMVSTLIRGWNLAA